MKRICKLAEARDVSIILIVLGILMQGVSAVQITASGGGTGESGSVSMNLGAAKDSSVDSQIMINGANIMPQTAISGSVPLFVQTHGVTDSTGKSASVSFMVVNAPSGVTYSSQVLPSEGSVGAQPQVSAEQWLTVPQADSIKTTASSSNGALSADVGLEETKGSIAGDFVTLNGYYGSAFATDKSVSTGQTVADGSANSIKLTGNAKDSTGSYSINTPLMGIAGGKAAFSALNALSSSGADTQTTQTEHITGEFTGTATAGAKSITRSSNYGSEYDLGMSAKKSASGPSVSGTVGYYAGSSGVASAEQADGLQSSVDALTRAVQTGGSIQGAVNAALAGDIINVAAGTFRENVKIDKSLSINGAGSTQTIVDGNKANSVFRIGTSNSNIDVALSGMKIQNGQATNGGGIINNGRLTITDSTISENTASTGGAGIYNGGTLNLIRDSVDHNTAAAHSADPYSDGGGIYNAGTLTLKDSNIAYNYADNGGAVFNTGYGSGGATATMTGGSMNNNIARFNGGAFYNDGIFTLNSGKIDHNQAMYGGGVFTWGRFTQNGGNIEYNHAIRTSTPDPRQPAFYGGYGGGVFGDDNTGAHIMNGGSINNNLADNAGGGLYQSGRFTMNAGTINDNKALQDGGGVANDGESAAYMVMKGGSIRNNVAQGYGGGLINWGTLTLKGGDISYNQAVTGYGGGVFADYGSRSVTFDGTSVKIQYNKAHGPTSQTSWYKSLGVYFGNTVPITANGFNAATQVTSNTRA